MVAQVDGDEHDRDGDGQDQHAREGALAVESGPNLRELELEDVEVTRPRPMRFLARGRKKRRPSTALDGPRAQVDEDLPLDEARVHLLGEVRRDDPGAEAGMIEGLFSTAIRAAARGLSVGATHNPTVLALLDDQTAAAAGTGRAGATCLDERESGQTPRHAC